MYKARYDVVTDPEGKKESILEVVFNFEKEVAPKDRWKAFQRMNPRRGGGIPVREGLLREYLREKEKLWFKDYDCCWIFSNGGREVGLHYPSRKKLKFRIRAIANRNISLENILDLDALNKFIVTGKID